MACDDLRREMYLKLCLCLDYTVLFDLGIISV